MSCSTCHFGRCSQPINILCSHLLMLFDLPFRQVFTAELEKNVNEIALFDLPFRQVFTADDR